MESLGYILKKLREDRGLQQKELADILNVHRGSISNWETDKRIPDKDTLIKIADYFNVSIDYLFGRAENTNVEVVEIKYAGEPYKIELKKGTKKELSQEDIQKMIDKLEAAGIDMETFIEKLNE